MFFSKSFFEILILISLALMSVGAISLIVMLFRDLKTKKLW